MRFWCQTIDGHFIKKEKILGEKLTIAILGDPHFVVQHGSDPHDSHTKLVINNASNSAPDMWSQLETLITSKKLSANILVTPGDITTRGDSEALTYGWKSIEKMAKQLSAELVVAATGNHDIKSRSAPPALVEERPVRDKALRSLEPTYPIYKTDETSGGREAIERQISYFGATLTQALGDNFRVVSFNTCSNHSHDEIDQTRGLFCQSTAKYVPHVLGKETKLINVLLCHHCPERDSVEDDKNHDFIDNFDQLQLSLQDYGRWVVIHGHKHVGKIHFGRSETSTNSPIIFSAASIGARTKTPTGADISVNHFYLMELMTEPQSERLLGKLRVFAWRESKRAWEENFDSRTKLSSYDGFGGDSQTLCSVIATGLHTKNGGSWAEIESQFPDVSHLTSSERDRLLKRLRNHNQIAVDIDSTTGCIGNWVRIEDE
jgi:hypothetical protein